MYLDMTKHVITTNINQRLVVLHTLATHVSTLIPISSDREDKVNVVEELSSKLILVLRCVGRFPLDLDRRGLDQI